VVLLAVPRQDYDFILVILSQRTRPVERTFFSIAVFWRVSAIAYAEDGE